jgi:hypothetical protein
MRLINHFLLMPEGDGGGGGAGGGETPETVNVSLPGGVNIALPKAQAESFLKAQRTANEERAGLVSRAAAAQAEKDTALANATRAEQEKEAIKAAAAGETEKARALFSSEVSVKLNKLQTKIRDAEIDAAIRTVNPGLDAAGVSDMRQLITPRASYDEATGSVVILGDDGKPLIKDNAPVSVLGHLPDWLASRPHFQHVGTPPGNGGKPPVVGGAGQKTIRLSELSTANAATIKGVTDGLIKVIE